MCKLTCSLRMYKPEQNLRFYHAVQCCRISDQIYSQGIIKDLCQNAKLNPKGDWANSMYVSSYKEVPRGYIVPKDGKYEDYYYMIELMLKSDLKYILCEDERFGRGTEPNCMISDEDLKNIENEIKKEKGETPFMTFLGSSGYAFECYHDDSFKRTELIVPADLITDTYFVVSKIEKCKVDGNGEIEICSVCEL